MFKTACHSWFIALCPFLTVPRKYRLQSSGCSSTKISNSRDKCRYWQTAGERKGENPMMTPLPYIIIFGMSTPFVILAIAFANGWIKVPVRWLIKQAIREVSFCFGNHSDIWQLSASLVPIKMSPQNFCLFYEVVIDKNFRMLCTYVKGRNIVSLLFKTLRTTRTSAHCKERKKGGKKKTWVDEVRSEHVIYFRALLPVVSGQEEAHSEV